jgi:ribonuclease BN (tRNA processing enzyme)
VEGRVAVDAGALATVLGVAEQAAITDVLLTHSHLDHVRDLPLAVINGDRTRRPLRVHGSAETLGAVRRHLFNREVWFDAFGLEQPLAVAVPVVPGPPIEIAGFRVTAFPLRHTVPSLGWLVDDGSAAVFFAGDTDQEDCLGPVVAAAGGRLRAVFLECSFPDASAEFARMTGHLTPASFARAAAAVPAGVPVYATHLKPGFEDLIAGELRAAGNPALRTVRTGDVLDA